MSKTWKDNDVILPSDAQRWEDKPDRDEVIEMVGDNTLLENHINNKNNPHDVTAEQLNVYTKDEMGQYTIFVGTTEEWNAIPPSEQVKYAMRGVPK